jgi:hypothetical protein
VTTNYELAHIPNPDILEQLRPPTTPVLSALGAGALRSYETTCFEAYRHDLMFDPSDADPRQTATTAADGYLNPDPPAHGDYLSFIDKHYEPHLTPDFYARHGFNPDTSIVEIVRQTTERDADGNFTMPLQAYVNLLADIQAIHAPQAEVFAGRLPAYISDFMARLNRGGLARLEPLFRVRSARADIVLDDGFDTLARGGSGRCETHLGGNPTIVVAPLPEEEHQILVHEFVHLLEGEGFQHVFADLPCFSSALREAVASHLSSYLINQGEIQDIDPNLSGRDSSEYQSYRHTLNILLNGGVNQTSVHQLIDAVTAGEAGPALAWRRQILESFPDNPELLSDLEARLARLQSAEGAIDADEEPAFMNYIYSLYDHYATLIRKAGRWSRLLNKLPWLAGAQTKS